MGTRLEAEEQIRFVEWARGHDDVKLVWSNPNEALYRNAKLRAMGFQKGMPDVMLIAGMCHYAIEFKREGESLRDDQADVLRILRKYGWTTTVAYSADEAKKFVERFL